MSEYRIFSVNGLRVADTSLIGWWVSGIHSEGNRTREVLDSAGTAVISAIVRTAISPYGREVWTWSSAYRQHMRPTYDGFRNVHFMGMIASDNTAITPDTMRAVSENITAGWEAGQTHLREIGQAYRLDATDTAIHTGYLVMPALEDIQPDFLNYIPAFERPATAA